MPTQPRWTHIALPSADLDATVEWYTAFTPLEVLARHADDDGQNAWLSHPGATDRPFVLVLVMFNADRGTPQPQLAPFAHMGIEVPSREAVDDIAERGADAGCLHWEARELPPPVGYVCALTDPDGNVVEFSFDQGVYAAVADKWGTA
ncbi:MAG: VOC family protein [Acidimicrobiia bacterium]|nr:VOC family protein [Acidimicrobiia bacterium]